MATTTNLLLPYPALSDPNNPPSDFQKLAARLDSLLEPTLTTVNSATGFGGSFKVYKNALWVNCTAIGVSNSGGTLSGNTSYLVATLPTALCPPIEVYVPVFYGMTQAGSATIYTNGQIKLWIPSGASMSNGKVIALNATWPAK